MSEERNIRAIETRAIELTDALNAIDQHCIASLEEPLWLAERLVEAEFADVAEALLGALHRWITAFRPTLEPTLEAYTYLFDRCQREGSVASLALLGSTTGRADVPSSSFGRRVAEEASKEGESIRKVLWVVGNRILSGSDVHSELDALLSLARVNGRRALMERGIEMLESAVREGVPGASRGRGLARAQASMIYLLTSSPSVLSDLPVRAEPHLDVFRRVEPHCWTPLDLDWIELAERLARFALEGPHPHPQAHVGSLVTLGMVLFRAGKYEELKRIAKEVESIVRVVPDEDQHLVGGGNAHIKRLLQAMELADANPILLKPPP